MHTNSPTTPSPASEPRPKRHVLRWGAAILAAFLAFGVYLTVDSMAERPTRTPSSECEMADGRYMLGCRLNLGAPDGWMRSNNLERRAQ